MQSLTRLYNIGRGPSSSHTMGPINAAKDFLEHYPNLHYYQVILFGSLAFTGRGHLTDQAILSVFGQRKVEIIFDYYQDLTHPNTLVFLGFNHPNKLVEYTIYTSIGGGAITRNGHLLS
ncbi:MAG: serine dehydratase beta chain, partial [Bacilli bacterium]